jgi:hypothetical protein
MKVGGLSKMTNAECKLKIYDLIATCSVNQRFHQKMSWRWGLADKAVKIIVALVAIAALITALGGKYWETWSIGFTVIAAIAAVILNVVPFGEHEKFYHEMFHLWSHLRIDVEMFDTKIEHQKNQSDPHLIERFAELKVKEHTLNCLEPAPSRSLLRKCQEDHNESIWGRNIRTPEQVEAERTRREQHFAASSAASGEGAD